MWRKLLPILLVLLSSGCTRAEAQQSVDALLDIVASPRAIPYAERQAAKDALIARPYGEVLPKLAVRIGHAPPEWSAAIRMRGPLTARDVDKSSPGEQAIWTLEEIWRAHTYGPKPPSFGHDLVRYLNDEAFREMRDRLPNLISIYWCVEAEEAITKLFADVKESPNVRYQAAYTLIHHARDKNLDAMLDFVQANPGPEAALFIRALMSTGFARFTDRPAESRLLMIAHDLMEQEIRETGRTSGGYHTALAMGDFIATRNTPRDARNLPNPFKARQDDPGMKRPDGNLSETFFETPVVRAREWWEKNGASVRSSATQPAR